MKQAVHELVLRFWDTGPGGGHYSTALRNRPYSSLTSLASIKAARAPRRGSEDNPAHRRYRPQSPPGSDPRRRACLRVMWQERPLRWVQALAGLARHEHSDQQRPRDVARTGHVQGKTPLLPLRSRFCQVSPLSEQGDLRQVVLIVLLSFMLSCIARGVATPWPETAPQAEKGPKGRP